MFVINAKLSSIPVCRPVLRCCLLLILHCRFPCAQSTHLKKEDIRVQISSLYGHYLLIFMFIPGLTSLVILRMTSEKQTALRIELHVPLFTGKAGPGDNKKGDIYCSLQQCVVPCQITAQVGRGVPPCWEEGRKYRGKCRKTVR